MKESSPVAISQEYLQLITQNQGLIYSHIRKMVGDPIFAQDALQETNIVLWQKASSFELGSNFPAFACRVGYLKTLELLRKKKRNSFLTFDSDVLESLGTFEEEDDTPCGQEQALAHCLQKLSPENRELLKSRYTDRKTVRQLAEHTKKSEGSLQQVFFKLRKALKLCIENQASEA